MNRTSHMSCGFPRTHGSTSGEPKLVITALADLETLGVG
jgi:hypothetical protein